MDTVKARDQVDEMPIQFSKTEQRLINRLDVIQLHDKTRTHLASMKLQNLTDLGWETLPQSPYFSDLPTTDDQFSSNLKFLSQKTLILQRRFRDCIR